MQKGFLYIFFSHTDFSPKIQIFLVIYTDFVLDQSGRSAIDLSSWFFAAAMANFRPQNLPFSAIYRKFYSFSWKILFSTIFILQVVFKSDKVLKIMIVPFLQILITVLKLPSVILEAAQSVFKLLLVPAVTLSTFGFTCGTIDAVIYTACCFLLFFPCTSVQSRYGQIPWLRPFSIFNLVFLDRERRLREENIKALVFLHYIV